MFVTSWRESGSTPIRASRIDDIRRPGRKQCDAWDLKMMLQGLAADFLMVLHLFFIAFVVFGGLLVFRWPRVIWVHLPAAAWGVLIEFNHWICPLTPLEQALRRAAGETSFSGGFTEHYLIPLIYPEGLMPETQNWLGLIVLLLNLLVYGIWLLRCRRPA